MLSNRIIAVTRGRVLVASKSTPATTKGWAIADAHLKRAKLHTSLTLQAETVKVPQMAESISEGTLKSWSKKVGDTVAADEEVATIETDKIDVSVNAPKAGTIVELLAQEEDTVTIGQDLFRIEAGEEGSSSGSNSASKPHEDTAPKKQESNEKPEELEDATKTKDKAEPKDQQVEKSPPPAPPATNADQHGGAVPAESKKEGEAKKEMPLAKEPAKDKTGSEKQSAPEPAQVPGSRNETRVKMNRMRLRIAERLKQSQNAAASLTTFNEIDMSSLMDMRKKFKDDILKERGVKLGYMSAFARAATLALREIPTANARIDGEEIVYHDYVDISVAVATPKGLVTPVVRNVEGMNFIQIEQEIAALGKKARDGKLALEDMSGGTFTISNGGVFGSLYGTPIINLPQSAVLGMHTIKDRAVVVDGQIVIRPIMIVALTYDHRLLDGREATTFLVKVKEYLEDPRKMLLA